MDDWQLLHQYAAEKSDDAFRTLVDRYAGLVYHTALRQTGNTHSAEEVAQNVFIALAQKAATIRQRSSLCGWLFRATRISVLNEARRNADRERHKDEVLAMHTAAATTESDSLWERLAPHLDDALEKLSEQDRELVMIRFFANKTHKELSDALGVSEQSARKRLSRALERLRVIFARRGIVVSSLVLAALLSTHGAKAAPFELGSSCSKVALAKATVGATTAATAGSVSLALLSSGKAPFVLVALSGLIVIGAALLLVPKSHSGPSLDNKPAINPAPSIAPFDATQSSSTPALAQPVANPATDSNSLAALDKIQAALNDPNPTTNYPNSVMQEAVAGLGTNKIAAIPILQGALTNSDARVRLRAIDGFGIVGPEAKESTPLLLEMLRTGGADGDPSNGWAEYHWGGMTVGIVNGEVILYSLAELGPAPELLPDLAQLVQESESARKTVAASTRRFSSSHKASRHGSWIWDLANGDSKAINDAFRPLLKNTNPDVRHTAASALATSLGDQADRGVFDIAIELLKSHDDRILRLDGLELLQEAGTDMNESGYAKASRASVNGVGPRPGLNAVRLGPYLNDTVAALADVARETSRQDLRLMASRLLDVLSPDFRNVNPHLASALEQEDQMQAFQLQAQSGKLTEPEMLEGLKRFPKAAPMVAEILARRGPDARKALPVLQQTLIALTPPLDASGMDRMTYIHARRRLADAIQKIAPDLPKSIFTDSDVDSINEILFDPVQRADPIRHQRVSEARKVAEWPTRGPFDVSPDQVRRLLAAMKEADTPTYDALLTKAKEIDPHFSQDSSP